MAESTGNYVGLFVDWDNLAISTAADMGGATPDIKRIIHKAQEYGQIIYARAYAEWNTMSERLSVYRAGIEPVYAPTFRFETDPVTQVSRGKSLADPVMVADCVDSLHIMPQLSVYVLVTGDKDMIPVVRLAQLRGKRVIVIGPDLVAGVLREMADEFVAYRALVQGEAGVPARTQEPLAPSHRRAPGRAPAPTRVPPLRPLSVMPQPPLVAEEREPAPAPAPVVVPAPAPAPAPDLQEVFTALVDVLRGMAGGGLTKVRATNLKDQLLLRLPGFSERRYGFGKFKDLLLAAERAGAVSVSAAGPVHWVSLPAVAVAEAPVRAEPAAPPVAPAAPVPQPIAPSPIDEAARAARSRQHRLAVIRYIDGLRQRSRWLTYTYVLTNVIGFIGRMVPQGEAEAEARSLLNHLVAEDVLRIDKTPQEVDVGGIKHRVRMCHFIEDNELVREAQAVSLDELPEEVRADLQPAPEPTEAQPIGSPEGEGVAHRSTPAGEPSLELAAAHVEDNGHAPLAEAQAEASAAAAEAEQAQQQEEAAELDDLTAERPRSRTRRGRRRGRGGRGRAEAGEGEDDGEPGAELAEAPTAEPQELTPPLAEESVVATPAGEAEVATPASARTDLEVLQSAAEAPEPSVVAPESAPAAIEPAQAEARSPLPSDLSDEETARAVAATAPEAELQLEPAVGRPTLEDVVETVRRIVAEQAALGKTRLTGSSLKLQLGKVFPGFSERAYGFTRFRDFLRAVEAAGAVAVDTERQVSWVRVPSAASETPAEVAAESRPEGEGEG